VMQDEKCFACDRTFCNGKKHVVDTRDGQTVFVGSGCYKKIVRAGDAGWQPAKGGPRLYLAKEK
jgi:hypothetical protein